MKCASLAFCTLSVLDLMSSSGISLKSKGTRSGLSSVEVSWDVSASVPVILLTRCISS